MKRNAAREQKFYFRINIFDDGKPVIKELTLEEIFNGCEDFIGLKAAVEEFLKQNKDKVDAEMKEVENETVEQVMLSIQYLCDISSGKVPTNATIMREFIKNHSNYSKNSDISEV